MSPQFTVTQPKAQITAWSSQATLGAGATATFTANRLVTSLSVASGNIDVETYDEDGSTWLDATDLNNTALTPIAGAVGLVMVTDHMRLKNDGGAGEDYWIGGYYLA